MDLKKLNADVETKLSDKNLAASTRSKSELTQLLSKLDQAVSHCKSYCEGAMDDGDDQEIAACAKIVQQAVRLLS